jgi:transcriptional regulator with XRE-family HTH domain
MTGNDVVRLRTKRGWSQRDLALRLEVDQSTVSRYETGKTGIPGPSRLLLEQLDAEPAEPVSHDDLIE